MVLEDMCSEPGKCTGILPRNLVVLKLILHAEP